MKSMLSTLLIPVTVLVLTVIEGKQPGRFSSVATVIQRPRPTPTPPPPPPGSIPPGDRGGVHRVYENASPSYDREILEQIMIKPKSRSLGARRRTSRARGRFMGREAASLRTCDPAKQLQNKFSGLYSGNIDFEGLGLRGDATLRICGNEFTLVEGEKKVSGVTASVITSGYAAAAFRFDEVTGFEVSLLALPKTVSVTVSRSGRRTSFRSAPREPNKFVFSGLSERHPRSLL